MLYNKMIENRITADELSSGTDIGDLERPWNPK